MKPKILFVVNVDWFLMSHRLPVLNDALAKGFEIHIATQFTSHKEYLAKNGYKVHSLNIDRSKTNILSLWSTFYNLCYLCRLIRPDLLHLVTIKPVLLGGLAARITRVPSVVYAISGLGYVFIANGLVANFKKRCIGLLYRISLAHRNSIVIFQNSSDQEIVGKLCKLPATSSVLIKGSGIFLNEYFESEMPGGTPIVMMAARLLKDKGVYEFINAARIVMEGTKEKWKSKKPRFVLVGAPDIGNPASVSLKELELWEREGIVELWGHRSDMPATLSLSSIVVLPSYREGLPKILIEAAACGRPVITTNVAGCRDAIVPNETGVLVPAKESKLLATAIQDLVANPQKRIEMGSAGRLFAEREFNVEDVIKKHLQIYQELISSFDTK